MQYTVIATLLPSFAPPHLLLLSRKLAVVPHSKGRRYWLRNEAHIPPDSDGRVVAHRPYGNDARACGGVKLGPVVVTGRPLHVTVVAAMRDGESVTVVDGMLLSLRSSRCPPPPPSLTCVSSPSAPPPPTNYGHRPRHPKIPPSQTPRTQPLQRAGPS